MTKKTTKKTTKTTKTSTQKHPKKNKKTSVKNIKVTQVPEEFAPRKINKKLTSYFITWYITNIFYICLVFN